MSVVAMVEAVPDNLLILDSIQYGKLVLALRNVRTAYDFWISRGGSLPIGNIDDKDAISIIREVIAHCPDEAEVEPDALAFLKDPELQASLGQDIAGVFEAVANAQWKAANILAGAAVEALLFWAAKRAGDTSSKSAFNDARQRGALDGSSSMQIDRWGLKELTEVALCIGAIKDGTAAEARICAGYRNLIHPGRADRLKQICDRGSAMAAAGALDHVIRDLSGFAQMLQKA